MSIDYYEKNASAFDKETSNADMSALYDIFLPMIPEGARIIDAGCGSGRDALFFHEHGYEVIAFDASSSLVEIARMRLPLVSVKRSTFMDFKTSKKVDAIWACASLLHVPLKDLPQTFIHLATFLKKEGVFYCSFKYGDSEITHNGRRFTNLNKQRLSELLSDTNLEIQDLWITNDVRPDRQDEKWLNAILKCE